jgi:hypothetical protein
MSLFFVSFAAFKKKKNIKSFVFALFIATLGVFIYGIGQKFFNWPVISTMNEEFSKGMALYLSQWTRINATFAGHYDLAAYLVLVISLFLGFVIGVKRKTFKVLGLALAFLAFYLLVLTASRVSFTAYLIAVLFVLFFTRKKNWVLPVVFLSLVFMVLNSDLGQRYAATFKLDLSFLSPQTSQQKQKIAQLSQISPTQAPVEPTAGFVEKEAGKGAERVLKPEKKEKKRIDTISAEFPVPETAEVAVRRSGAIRFQVEWPRAWRAFVKNPLLGTGYSSVTLATDNDYLRSLAETGFLGLGALLLIFLEMAKEFLLFLKKAKTGLQKAVVIGIGGAVLGFLANALFIDVFEASKVAFVFWILCGTMVSIVKKFQVSNSK